MNSTRLLDNTLQHSSTGKTEKRKRIAKELTKTKVSTTSKK